MFESVGAQLPGATSGEPAAGSTSREDSLRHRLDAAGPFLTADLEDLLSQVADLDTDELFLVMQAFDRVTAWSQAGGLTLLAELLRREWDQAPASDSASDSAAADPASGRLRPGDSLIAEVACALGLTEYSAGLRISTARALSTRHPWLMDALAAGRIDLPKARVLIEATRHLSAETAGLLSLRLLAKAELENTSQLRQRARAAVEQVDPSASDRRAKRAESDRTVWLQPGPESGLSLLGADLPHADAAQLYGLVDQAARALRSDDRAQARAARAHSAEAVPVVRTLAQCRADALVALLAGDCDTSNTDTSADTYTDTSTDGGGETGVVPHPASSQAETSEAVVSVVVSLADLLHHSDPPLTDGTEDDPCLDPGPFFRGGPPGQVQWLGPICPQTARDVALTNLRQLAGGRVGVRWVGVDDAGHAVAVTGTSYQIPPLLRALIEVRDVVCRFPGCTRPAQACDGDHTIAYPHGPTAACNLACLCRRHHRLKTHSRWRVRQTSRGLAWTSPHGATYLTHPATWAEQECPTWLTDPSIPPPEDAIDASTPEDYEAWVEQLCERADGTGAIDATGPDLPTLWWAEALPPWDNPPDRPADEASDEDPDDSGGGISDPPPDVTEQVESGIAQVG